MSRIGLQLGEWTLGSVLGLGGMACVYAAHNDAGQEAAVKVVERESTRDAQLIARFVREAEILEQLAGHPAALNFFGSGETPDGVPYMVIELLRGQELAGIAKGKKLEPALAVQLCEPILNLLDVCHRQGIVHRDLKPANVFVCDSGVVKVLDFGVARVRQSGAEQTQAGMAIGTAAYMAPEQAIGRSDLTDGRADLFAVGAILYYLLSGTRIRAGKTFEDVFIQAATTPPSSLARVAPDLPLQLIQAVDKALAWDPRDRFQTAQEMRESLLGSLAQGSGPVSAVPEGLGGTLPVPLLELSAEATDEDEQVEHAEALVALREVMRSLDHTLHVARQYEWGHIETTKRFEAFVRLVETTLRSYPESLEWSVKPSAFVVGEDIVWAPEAALGAIPYNLFAGGIHHLQLTPGVSADELERFLRFLMLDPARDLSEEDDLSVRLWELGFEKIRYQLVSGFQFTERDRSESGVDSLESITAEAVAKEEQEILGMLLATGRNALAEASSMLLGIGGGQRTPETRLYEPLDEERRSLLADSSGAGGRDAVSMTEVLVRSLQEAERGRDLPRLKACLEDIVPSYVRETRVHAVLQLLCAVRDRLSPATEARRFFTQVSLGRERLSTLLDALARSVRADESDPSPLLMPLLEDLGASAMGPVLGLVPRTTGLLYEELLRFVAQHALGSERAIGAALVNAGPEFGNALIEVLVSCRTADAKEALRFARQNSSFELRLKALERFIELAPDEAASEVADYLPHPDPGVRIRALRALAPSRDPGLAPLLVSRLALKDFGALPHIERRLLLETLHRTDPRRAEQEVVVLLSAGNTLTRSADANSRLMAVHFLAQHGATPASVRVLQQVLEERWGNSPELRKAAATAADRVRNRLEESRS